MIVYHFDGYPVKNKHYKNDDTEENLLVNYLRQLLDLEHR
jgi:hypothetical protein